MEPGWWSPAQPEDMRWALHEMWLEQLAMPRMQLAKRLASHMSLRTNSVPPRTRSRLRGSLSPVMRSTPVGSSAHGNAHSCRREIYELVIDDQRLRNKICWSLFEC